MAGNASDRERRPTDIAGVQWLGPGWMEGPPVSVAGVHGHLGPGWVEGPPVSVAGVHGHLGPGWVEGPPILRPPPRGRFVATGAALALIVAIGGIGVVGLVVPGRPTVRIVADGPTFDPRPTADLVAPPRLEATDCRFQPPMWLSVSCHDLHVPQDRTDAAKGITRIHVAVFESLASDPAPDPVVFLSGGPGSAGLIDYADPSVYPFLDRGDLIVIDQRGTGSSVPSLDCPEYDAIVPLRFAWALDGLGAVRDCRDRLVADGVDLASYTSADSAADLADLQEAIDVAEWNLYGVSYGTRLALTAMRDRPEGIRSVILDAPYPPQADIYGEGALNAARAFTALFDGCGGEPACRDAHPDLESRFYTLAGELTREPITLSSRDGSQEWPVDGSVLLNYLFDRLYVTPLIPTLPGHIEEFLDGDMGALTRYLEEAYPFPGSSDDPFGIADGMYLSVQCHDELAFFDRSRFDAAGLGLEPEVVAAFDPAVVVAQCGIWDVPGAGAIEREAVRSDIPTLLLTGEFDPITPPRWAADAAATLSRSQVVAFPRAGHGVLPDVPCATSIVRAFLDRPTDIDDPCLSKETAPAFEP